MPSRHLALLVALFITTTTSAQTRILQAIGQERPVSDPLFTAAAEHQGVPLVATNGRIALAVWSDRRSGEPAAYATRIGSDAVALESLGIPLGTVRYAEAVVWNGSEFMVVLRSATERVAVFVTEEGRVSGRKRLDFPLTTYFAAARTPGPDVRLLFIGSRTYVVDGQAAVTMGAPLSLRYPNLAAGTRSGFLVLDQGVSFQLDPDGGVLRTATTGLPFMADDFDALGAGDDGFLLVREDWLDPAVTGYRLDRDGVFQGPPIIIKAADSSDKGRYGVHVSVTAEASRYLVTWDTAPHGGHSFIYVADVTSAGASGVPHVIADWVGLTAGARIVSSPGFRIVVSAVYRLNTSTGYDSIAQTLGDSLDAGPPALVTASATLQSNAHVAVADASFAATWTETGSDAFHHLFIRRFTLDGAPIDDAPIELGRVGTSLNSPYPPQSAIVSNGETYLAVWQGVGRRMAARTGEWLDSEPFDIGLGFIPSLASDGTDILAGGATSCNDGFSSCLAVRRIAMIGDPLTFPVVTLTEEPARSLPALASDGTDYLATWIEGPPACPFECPATPTRLVATRLRADGTKIDSEPLVLEESRYPAFPSVAWNAGIYLVASSEIGGIRGRRMTAEGAVLDPDGMVLAPDGVPSMLAYGDGFALLHRSLMNDPNAGLTAVRWDGVVFSAKTDLSEVAALPRKTLATFGDDLTDSFGASARGETLILAYNHTSDRSLGSVSRVVTRRYAALPGRRRTAAR